MKEEIFTEEILAKELEEKIGKLTDNYQIYTIMWNLGYTDHEIKERLGVTRRTISRYHYGTSGKYPKFVNYEGTPREQNYMNIVKYKKYEAIVLDNPHLTAKRIELYGLNGNQVVSVDTLEEFEKSPFYPRNNSEEVEGIKLALELGLPEFEMVKFRGMPLKFTYSYEEMVEKNKKLASELKHALFLQGKYDPEYREVLLNSKIVK